MQGKLEIRLMQRVTETNLGQLIEREYGLRPDFAIRDSYYDDAGSLKEYTVEVAGFGSRWFLKEELENGLTKRVTLDGVEFPTYREAEEAMVKKWLR